MLLLNCKTFIVAMALWIGNGGYVGSLKISSTAFKQNDFIPVKYTCEGTNVNPPIEVSGIPAGSKSLALIVVDPDAPEGTVDHWVMWNIDPAVKLIAENSAPGTQGKNTKNENKYMGPCPPDGMHHYHFKVYALDTKLDLTESTQKTALEAAMKDHILAMGELIGLYQKKGLN